VATGVDRVGGTVVHGPSPGQVQKAERAARLPRRQIWRVADRVYYAPVLENLRRRSGNVKSGVRDTHLLSRRRRFVRVKPGRRWSPMAELVPGDDVRAGRAMHPPQDGGAWERTPIVVGYGELARSRRATDRYQRSMLCASSVTASRPARPNVATRTT
jgi:hypothetical protein